MATAAPIDDAKVAFGQGKDAFERGDYEAALTHFQRANSLVPAPSLQYNIGTTYERLGRWREAAGAFDKYLELAGTPTTDDEKDFQEKLRARAASCRRRAEQQAPPPPANMPPPQQPTYYPPSPYYGGYYGAQPYATPPVPREVRLKDARARRGRAIALVAVGSFLTIVGVGVLAAAAVVDYCPLTVERTIFDCGANWGVGFVGFTSLVVGITLWAPGAASWAKSQKDINELMRPEPKPMMPAPTASPGAPAPMTLMLQSPVFRF